MNKVSMPMPQTHSPTHKIKRYIKRAERSSPTNRDGSHFESLVVMNGTMTEMMNPMPLMISRIP